MGARTSGREAALQMLFALETSGRTPEQVIAWFWRDVAPDAADPGLTPESRAYADEAVQGVAHELERIDAAIRAASTNWRLERMARVDRNVLRLGVWELSSRPEVPRAVALDEAVELAKRFGSEDSGAFVNGVLDRVAEDLGRTA